MLDVCVRTVVHWGCVFWLLWRRNEMRSTASLVATVLREHKQLADLGLESSKTKRNRKCKFQIFFPSVSRMAGCCCRLCVLADPVFLAATESWPFRSI